MKLWLPKISLQIIDPFEDYEAVLEKILSWIQRLMIVVGIPVVTIGVIEAIQLNQPNTAIIYIVLFIPVLVLCGSRKWFHYKVRAGLVVILVYVLAAHNIFVYGFSGAGIPLFLVFFIIVTVFFGLKAGLLSIILAIIPMIIIGSLMIRGVIEVDVDLMAISVLPISWITAISVLFLLGTMLVVSYHFIHYNLLHIINITKNQAEDLKVTNQNLVEEIKQKEFMQKNLEQAKNKAEESDRLKSAFLANISHEIRTPVNGILGFARLMKEKQIGEKERDEYLDFIEKSGHRMLNIINDLINISKIEAGQMEVNYSNIRLNEQMDYLYHLFLPKAEEKGIELSVHYALPSERTMISTDKEKFVSVLSNLINNAIKFTDEGSVVFGYTRKNNQLEFYVKDTGKGIPEEKQKHIFDRFFQADTSFSRGYEGAGLGLSISKEFVKMLGGEIGFESKAEYGATFYFTLPLAWGNE